MSVFILVPGFFTTGEVWAEVAGHLEATGAEVHVVDPVRSDAPGRRDIVLDTHVEQVVAAIDRAGPAPDRDIVLVGHDYGVYPALGAADRRAERVARLVYVDAAPAPDGVPALAAVPDQALRARLAAAVRPDSAGSDSAGHDAAGPGASGPDAALSGGPLIGGALPPPAPHEWQGWGSTRGLSAAVRERLTDLSAPHPLGTLTQPLKLTGAAASAPTTGVLCHYNGSTIESVRMLARLGTPALQPLLRPDVTFFELHTGHWPMLSCPGELADVLVRAAADEGERLTTPEATDPDTDTAGAPRSFLLDVPLLPRERHGSTDLYLPPRRQQAGPLPAVVFVHGGPVPPGMGPRDWPVIQGYARYAASRGVIGVALEHRLHDVTDYPVAAGDVADAVEAVRADARVDADRIALWFLSGSGPLTAEWLDGPPSWLRCLVAGYPVMSPLPNWGVPAGRFRPAQTVAAAASLPMVVLRPELEQPVIAATVDEFLAAAAAQDVPVDVIDIPGARHGFEDLDHTGEARDAVRRAMTHVLNHLGI